MVKNNNVKNFINATKTDRIRVNNNPTDFQSFRDFQDRQEKLYDEIEKNKRIEERSKQLRVWDEKTPPRWRGASLRKMNRSSTNKILDIISSEGAGSFYLYGSPQMGKSYISYAIARTYIGKGLTSFSRVKIISEENLLSLARAGFEGIKRTEEIFDKKYNLYILDGVAEREGNYSDKEASIWERLIEHVYSHSLYAIFTSNVSLSDFTTILSSSTTGKLDGMLEDRVIEVEDRKDMKIEFIKTHEKRDATSNNDVINSWKNK